MTPWIKYSFILLLTLTPFVCRAQVDGLALEYISLDTAAAYHIGDPDSLLTVMKQLPFRRSMELRIWLTDDVSARMLIAGLNMCPDVPHLSLYHGRDEIIDSVLSLVVLPRLEGVTIVWSGVPKVPRSLSRFPHLTFLYLDAIDGYWPCIDADSVPNLETFAVFGPLRFTDCGCVRKRQIVEGHPENPDQEFDYERLFILTGVYTRSTCVIDLFGSLFLSLSLYQHHDTIPIVGSRNYAVVVHGQQRLQIAEGIVDRILAVLIAQAQRGEHLFDGERTTVNAEFLRVIRDTSTTTTRFEFESDRVVINGTFVYRGPLISLINEMIEQGCL